jgi:hypothetical protein
MIADTKRIIGVPRLSNMPDIDLPTEDLLTHRSQFTKPHAAYHATAHIEQAPRAFEVSNNPILTTMRLFVDIALSKAFAVDLRKSKPTFGPWVGQELSEDNNRQLWIRPGFAHGFFVLSEVAVVLYKTTGYYAPQHERCLIWNDQKVAIAWPLDCEPLLSAKDKTGLSFHRSRVFPVKVLITDANGQVGWELQSSLSAVGDVLALNRKACDLSRPHDLPSIIRDAKPDVVNAAASFWARKHGKNTSRLGQNNRPIPCG